MEKQRIVKAHNNMRQMVAMGSVKNQPAADNMREMVWDEELAVIAQVEHDHSEKIKTLTCSEVG